MKAIFAILGTAALLSTAGGGQSMMEHAAAAAGAVAGTAGGKTMSNGIDKILGRAAEAASDASKLPSTKPAGKETEASKTRASTSKFGPATAPGAAAFSTAGAPVSSPGAGLGLHRAARARRDPADPAIERGESQRDVSELGVSHLDTTSVTAVPPSPKPEDFEKIAEGESRDEVLSALGIPSSHVTIPDDGHLIELMSWWDGQRRVGSVRIDNGKVISKSF